MNSKSKFLKEQSLAAVERISRISVYDPYSMQNTNKLYSGFMSTLGTTIGENGYYYSMNTREDSADIWITKTERTTVKVKNSNHRVRLIFGMQLLTEKAYMKEQDE